MDCPHTSKEMPPLPPSEAPPNEIQAFAFPQETMSLVSGPSSNGKTSFSSPLKPVDLGVPETPEQRQLVDIDGIDIEDGYDSDGLQAPWEGSKLAAFDLREAEESSSLWSTTSFIRGTPCPKCRGKNIDSGECF